MRMLKRDSIHNAPWLALMFEKNHGIVLSQ